MKTTKNLLATISLCLGLFAAASTSAAPVTFDLKYSGTDYENNASASGTITFDISNEGTYSFSDQGPAISLTIADSGTGNGTFVNSDFQSFTWLTGGIDFDFGANLVGQTTLGGKKWGTTAYHFSDDYEMISDSGAFMLMGLGDAPVTHLFFDLTTSSGDKMKLTEMKMQASSVPVPAAAWLLGSGLIGLVGVARRKAA